MRLMSLLQWLKNHDNEASVLAACRRAAAVIPPSWNEPIRRFNIPINFAKFLQTSIPYFEDSTDNYLVTAEDEVICVRSLQECFQDYTATGLSVPPEFAVGNLQSDGNPMQAYDYLMVVERTDRIRIGVLPREYVEELVKGDPRQVRLKITNDVWKLCGAFLDDRWFEIQPVDDYLLREAEEKIERLRSDYLWKFAQCANNLERVQVLDSIP